MLLPRTTLRRFVARLPRTSFRQVTAVALTVALLAPTSALARPVGNDRTLPPSGALSSALNTGWMKMLAFLNAAQGRGPAPQRGMPAPERPLPQRIAPRRPPTKAEREARVTRLETNARGTVELRAGQRMTFSAIPLDAEGDAVHGLLAEWQSSDPAVVSVTKDGEATAKAAGLAQLTATAGGKRATVTVQVAPGAASSDGAAPQGSARYSKTEKNAGGDVRFVNASVRRARGAKFIPASLAQGGGSEGTLPDGETNSLYSPENDVGFPRGRTEPGAITPPTAVSGTETPLSGNFTFNLPLVNSPGRGLDAGLGLTYNSRLWHKSTNSGGQTVLTYDVDRGWPGPGFRIGPGFIEAQGSHGFTLVDSGGTRRQLIKSNPGDPNDNKYETTDGTFIRFEHTGDATGNLYYPDGTRVLYGGGGSQYDPGARSYPNVIRERNGNHIIISYVYLNNTTPRIDSVSDTLGRFVRFHYDENDPGRRLLAITAPGYEGGADRRVARFYYEDLPVNASFTVATRAPQTTRVLRYVYFNTDGVGTGYRFDYSSYGMIYRTTQLRGMTVSYTGLDQMGSVTGEGQTAATTEYNYPVNPSNLADAPQFTRRTDDWAGRTAGMPGTGEAPYHTFAVDQAQGISTVTAPDGTVTESRTTVAPGQWNDGLVTENTVRQGQAVMGRTVTTWEHDGNSRNHRPQQAQGTNEVGQTGSTAYGYTSYNNVSVVRERGFGGEELRRTETAYVTSAEYISRGLLRLPTSVRVYAGGSSTPSSRVDYAYDEGTPAARPDIIMNASVDNPQYAYRGNVTTTTGYADAANGAGAETDTFTYDIAGNLLTQTASCCQQRSFTYTKGFEYAYPTEVARGSAGQLRTQANYDFNTGLVRSGTDENNQTTVSHYYPDSLRYLQTNRPDGGYTEITYGDRLYADAGRMHGYVSTKTLLSDSGRNGVDYQYVDGRGATARSFGYWDGINNSTTDTEYDLMGRPQRTSNPYYTDQGTGSPVNPAGLWTTSEYDALGRAKSVRLPDNNTASVSYAGTVTTGTDAANRSRRQITDALGRVVRVDEPDAYGNLGAVDAPAQPTHYSYDILNNLVRVQQGGQNRYFKYDSLSRMTYERSVEQDAPHYAPDAVTGNNHWSRRTVYNTQGLVTDGYDARGVQTHFNYDGLNRVREVTYSDGTPSVTYNYDQARAGYHNQGKLTEVVTAATASAPQTVQAYDYNSMGRVAAQRQTIAASSYAMSYGYNPAGQLTNETYPSGRVVNYGYDYKARLESVTGGDGRTYASNFAWNGHGGLASETWGNGAVRTMGYNDRLQPTQIRLTAGGVERQRYDYQYGRVDMGSGGVDASRNTGQIARIDSFIGGAKQWEQRISYDSLGRLDLAAEHRGDNGALEWRADYDYDRYGNRYQYANVGFNYNLSYTPVEGGEVNQGTNRFASNVGYDAAGNVTADAKFRGMEYRYDANGRQRWAAPLAGGGAEATAVYDGRGQRVQTSAGGVTRHLIYDAGGKLVDEYEPGNGGWKRDHIYRGGALLVTEEGGGAGQRYVFSDHQGSTRLVTDGSGGVQARHDYLPFGEEIAVGTGMRTSAQGYGAMSTTRQRYAGTERDEGTGLEHTLWRKLEARAGRWTSPDPYRGSMSFGDPQSMNRYAYVGNDPVNRIDPSGLSWFDSFNDLSSPRGMVHENVVADYEMSLRENLGGAYFSLPGLSNEAEQGMYNYEGWLANERNQRYLVDPTNTCTPAQGCYIQAHVTVTAGSYNTNYVNYFSPQGVRWPYSTGREAPPPGSSVVNVGRSIVTPPAEPVDSGTGSDSPSNIGFNLCFGEAVQGCYGLVRNSNGSVYQNLGLSFGPSLVVSPSINWGPGHASPGLSLTGSASLGLFFGVTGSQPLYPRGQRSGGYFIGTPNIGGGPQLTTPVPPNPGVLMLYP